MTSNIQTQEHTEDRQENNVQTSSSPDFRIQINAFRADDMNFSVQQNISSLIHQARNQANTRTWRMNFSNVFQGVRPFVQQAQSINNLRSWTNSYRYVPMNHTGSRNDNSIQNNPSSNSITVNVDSTSSDLSTSEGGSDMNLGRSINLPSRPLLERVAQLTRNDPPDLIGGPSRNHNQENGNHNNNNNGHEENAVAEVFAQIPEARRAFETLYRYIPLICILLAKSAYDHIEALTDFAVLIAVFIHSNSLVKDQVSKQIQRKILILFREILFIVFMIFFKFFAVNRKNPFICLPLFTSINEAPTLSQLLYWVAATDFLIKSITVSIKILIVMLPPRIIKYKGRGRYFVFIEALSQLYRSLAPIQLWLLFLLDSYTGMEKILGVVFSAAYMVAKGFDLVERAKLFKKAFVGFLRQVNYGQIPTKDEIQEAGSQCPICHDNYDTPVKLECNHIFCELCVGTWFTREQTCPLCRAQVAEDPSWQDGATTHFIQLY